MGVTYSPTVMFHALTVHVGSRKETRQSYILARIRILDIACNWTCGMVGLTTSGGRKEKTATQLKK